jgi:hypothetical protein
MAIVKTAGTEIIRTIHYETVVNAESVLIFGEQHHIYTVLSIIVHSVASNTAGNRAICYVKGYDSRTHGPTTDMIVFKAPLNTLDTFVWNDKFSMNGHMPTTFTEPMDDATKQNALAEQGGAAQKLVITATSASDNFHVHCTYIDQNNA